MNIYAITISGEKFYFLGELLEQECVSIEQECKRISQKKLQLSAEEVLSNFLETLDRSLVNKMLFFKIQHVFRI